MAKIKRNSGLPVTIESVKVGTLFCTDPRKDQKK